MLTGMVNRRWFEEAAAAEWRRCLRYGREATLIVFDLDRFKQINDEHGHAAGDIVLRQVADACRAEIRDMDMVAGIGGEELAVLLADTPIIAGGRLAARPRRRKTGRATAREQVCKSCYISVVDGSSNNKN